MDKLSQNDLKVIKDCPLGDGLDAFRSNFIVTHSKGKGVDNDKVVDDLISHKSYASES